MTVYFDIKSGTPVALPILQPKRLISTYTAISNGAIPSPVNNKVHVTQLGSNALISFVWGGGTATVSTSNTILFNMPTGMTINTALIAGAQQDHLGAADWYTNVSGGTHKPLKPQVLGSTSIMFCDEYNGQNFIESAVGTGWLISGWVIVPILEWVGMDTSSTGVSGGGGGGGLAPRAITTTTTAVSNIMYAALVASSYTVTLPGGTTEATVGFLDPTGAYTDTNYLDIAPVTGQTIAGGASGEALRLRKAYAQVVLYRVAGTTNWVIQAQATTTIAGGSVPAKVPTSTTDVITSAFIGYVQDASVFTPGSYGTGNVLSNVWAEVSGLVLGAGIYEIYAEILFLRNGATFSSISDVLLGWAVPAGASDPFGQNGWWSGSNAPGYSTSSSNWTVSSKINVVCDGTNISIQGRPLTAGNTIRMKTFLGTWSAGTPTLRYLLSSKKIG